MSEFLELLAAVIYGIAWIFISEDIYTKWRLRLLAELNKLNSKEK